MDKKIFLASNNQKKIEEIRLALPNYNIYGLKDILYQGDIIENGDSFAENAQIKVDALKSLVDADAFIMGEDSGLVVESLDGAPGIYSARYAGEDCDDRNNIEKLLNELSKKDNRKAYFITTICFWHDHKYHFFEGTLHGSISMDARGKEGFGYDPIFVPEGESNTLAELGMSYKSENSHRVRAIQQMLEFLK